MVAAVLRFLPEQVRLQREDVVEHPVDAPALEAVVRNHPGVLQVATERCPERTVDPRLPTNLRLFEELQAPVERDLPRPVRPDTHSVPSTSTRPALVTRTCTVFSEARLESPAGRPSASKAAG